MKKLVGFKLIQTYPGCNKPLGYFEKLTDGSLLKYPYLWQPIYVNVNIEDCEKKIPFIDAIIAYEIFDRGLYNETSREDIKHFIALYNYEIMKK